MASVLGAITPLLAYLSPLKGRGPVGTALEDRSGSTILPESISEGTAVVGQLAGRPTLVIRKNGQLLGFAAVCTHLGCMVRWSGTRIECPCHGGTFDLRGEVVSGPPPTGLERIPLREETGEVLRA